MFGKENFNKGRVAGFLQFLPGQTSLISVPSVPPTVSILGKPQSGQFLMPAGSELGLVCLAGGEPAPSLTWTRGDIARPGLASK